MKTVRNLLSSKIIIFNLLVILFLLTLPYLLFDGKLFLGGDDTRLFYSYPTKFIQITNFFSWTSFSSIGSNNSNQYLLPFLTVWSILSAFISSKVFLNYLAFSFPLILGFIYFQKSVKELLNLPHKNDLELFIGSMFYIFSPILIINQMFIFLTSMWLLGLIPIVIYYFLKYLKTGSFSSVYIVSVWCLILSSALFSVPWILGLVLPTIPGLIFLSFFTTSKQKILFVKRSIIFFGFILISQSFWILSFAVTYLSIDQNSFAYKIISQGFVDTFTPTVLSTATGYIIYPLLGLFHRQIPFDFGWALKDVFISFYDKTFILNSIYIIVLALGVFNFKKILNKANRSIFIFLLVSFISSLYLFTVNIGPLKDLFILFKNIPAFVMFRNFYDKFAPGYVILYSALMVICLVIVRKRFPSKFIYIFALIFLIVVLNFSTVRSTVNSPLWGTKNIYRTITIPEEYINFMSSVGENVSSTNNLFSVPFGTSIYTVIKDKDTQNVYVGVSPVKVFSGVNDFSGHLSFNFTKEADVVDSLIINRNYSSLKNILFEHNINYLLLTKNIPDAVKGAWVYDSEMLNKQDSTFISEIANKKLIVSSSGNYELYKTKKNNSLINSKNVYFQKISPVKYVLYIKNISKTQELSFVDSYHAGWKLFIQKNPSLSFCVSPIKNSQTGSSECKSSSDLFQMEDLNYLTTKPVFNSSHELIYKYANKWTIDQEYIKNNYNKDFYKVNNDGTVDLELVLYFVPQTYFYLGTIVTILVFISGAIYLFRTRYEKNT